MRKRINFAIAATIVALALIFWVKASGVENHADAARPKFQLSAPMASPYLPVQTLEPVY
jgi:hypothetical protein